MGVRAYWADAYNYHSDEQSDEKSEKVNLEVEEEKELALFFSHL